MPMTHRQTQPRLGRGNCVCREGRVPSRLPTPGGPEGARSQRHNFPSCQPGSRYRRFNTLSSESTQTCHSCLCQHTVHVYEDDSCVTHRLTCHSCLCHTTVILVDRHVTPVCVSHNCHTCHGPICLSPHCHLGNSDKVLIQCCVQSPGLIKAFYSFLLGRPV